MTSYRAFSKEAIVSIGSERQQIGKKKQARIVDSIYLTPAISLSGTVL
jgi:hypothetical protein